MTVETVADATTADVRARTWAIGEEVVELAKLDSARRGKTYYSTVGHNAARVYAELIKWLCASGDGTITVLQLVERMYPGIECADDARRKAQSVRNWLRLLERVGLVRTSVLTKGTGKSIGLRYELLDVAEAGAKMGASRGCSSVGYSVSSEQAHSARRRRLPKKVRQAERVRPWCPRAGHGSTTRFVDAGHPDAAPPPSRPLFSPERFCSPGAFPEPLRGPGKASTETDAHANGPPDGADVAAAPIGGRQQERRDAIWAACPADQRAALDRLRQTGIEGGAVGLRLAGGADGAPWAALALAAWATFLPDVEPRCSKATAAQLDRSGTQLARFWGRADAVDFVVGQVEDLGPAGVDPLTGNVARTIKVVAIVVKQAARRARRHALGKPAPRPHRARGDGWL